MKEYELFEVIGEVDEALLAASEAPRARRSWMRFGAIGACAVLLLAVTLPFAKRTYEDIRLRLISGDVKIQRVYGTDRTDFAKYMGSHESYAYNYTPAELLAEDTDIVWGKITRMETFQVEYSLGNQTMTTYYTRMTLRVKRVYRGELSKWEKIEVLLPQGVYGTNDNHIYNSFGGAVLGKLEKGMEGIFMLSAYVTSEDAAYGMAGDLADYRLADGRRCILQDENEILTEKMWEDVLSECETLQEVGEWFSEQIK